MEQHIHKEAEGRPTGADTVGRNRRGVVLWVSLILLLGLGTTAYLWRPWEAGASTQSGEQTLYTCTMHPQVVKEGPGVCPICHMELVPKRSAHVEERHDADTGSSDAHDAMVHLTNQERIRANVRTTKIEYRTIGSSVQAAADVDYAETSQRVVSARYRGRIERLFVRETGGYVARGARLMEIYSPELVSAQQEFLIARDAVSDVTPVGGTGNDDARRRERNERMIRASRKRLELLGMTESQIDALRDRGEISYTTTVFAPVSGVVVRKGAVEGAYVDEGTMLLELVDLSTVWVKANVYEADLPNVRVGATMSVTGPALGGETMRGRVDLIYPTVDASSRTAQVRAVFANPGYRLKPGMYVTATIPTSRVDALVVPVGAVVRTGKRDLVYVEAEPNMFEARQVELGRRDGEYYEIVGGGVQAGDVVAAEGGYLLDSEATLSSGTVDPHAGHDMGGMEK